MTRKLLYCVKISGLLFLFLLPGTSFAQEVSLSLPSTLSGEGTHFEITDSDYLNIIFDSTEPIKIDLESIPETISFLIRPVSPTTSSAQITIEGLEPSTKYFKYEDSYHNLVTFTSDPNGSYSYTQDLTKLHLVFIQPRESTVFIKDDPTGGNCTAVGTWDFPNKICTLTTDVFSSIQIDDNGITLDGNNHSVIGTDTGFGIFLSFKSNITIKNLTIRNFSNGMRLFVSGFLGGIQILDNNMLNNQGPGIFLNVSRNTVINNNVSTNNGSGIAFNGSTLNTITNNDASNNVIGLSFNVSSGNTISFNTFQENTVQDVKIFARFENNCPNTFLNNIGSGSRPIKYFSSPTTLQNETLSSLILCNADGSLIDNVTIEGSDTLKNNGLFLVQTDNTTIRDVTSSDNEVGIFLNASSNNNLLEDNTITSNFERGIILANSDNNIIRNNLIVDSGFGLSLVASDNNQIFNNNFIDNNIFQAVVGSNSFGNIFNLPTPDGGNFWNDFNEPGEGCNDVNSDGFCDTPKTFPGGQDNLPWTIQDGWKEKTLPERAAELAKQLVNSPYLYGGKGWDYQQGEFVAPDTVKTGYDFWNQAIGSVAFDTGVDCSGLIMWSYNRSFDSTKPRFENFVKAEGADEQFRENTVLITEAQLQPGDVMFFDFDNDGFIDHNAMFVGESGGFDVVSAANPTIGIISDSKNRLKDISGFVAFKRVVSALPPAILVSANSPVDLIVTDPDGFTITPDTIIPSDLEFLRQIPGVLYYSEIEKGTDNRPIDQVYSYIAKTGDYLIRVLSEPDALPTDTYSLLFTTDLATTTILAENIPISDIPDQPYIIRSSDGVFEKIIPAKIRITPKTLNLGDKGVFSVLVEISNGFGASVANIDTSTIEIQDIAADRTVVAKDKFVIAFFKTQDLSDIDSNGDVELKVTGRLKDGTKFEGADTVRIINQGRFSSLSFLLANLYEVLTTLLKVLSEF